jgi:hypothetical protein
MATYALNSCYLCGGGLAIRDLSGNLLSELDGKSITTDLPIDDTHVNLYHACTPPCYSSCTNFTIAQALQWWNEGESQFPVP